VPGRPRGASINELFGRYRDRLRAMVRLRLNRRLQGRVDPSDVLQEAYLEVCKGFQGYMRAPPELRAVAAADDGRGHGGITPMGSRLPSDQAIVPNELPLSHVRHRARRRQYGRR
jgi:hypothetical protein